MDGARRLQKSRVGFAFTVTRTRIPSDCRCTAPEKAFGGRSSSRRATFLGGDYVSVRNVAVYGFDDTLVLDPPTLGSGAGHAVEVIRKTIESPFRPRKFEINDTVFAGRRLICRQDRIQVSMEKYNLEELHPLTLSKSRCAESLSPTLDSHGPGWTVSEHHDSVLTFHRRQVSDIAAHGSHVTDVSMSDDGSQGEDRTPRRTHILLSVAHT